MNELFSEYDAMIMPAGSIAPEFNHKSDTLSDEYLLLENHLAIANFGGFPSITIPNGFVNEMPICINITGKAKDDALVLNIANKIEESMEYKNMIASEVSDNV